MARWLVNKVNRAWILGPLTHSGTETTIFQENKGDAKTIMVLPS